MDYYYQKTAFSLKVPAIIKSLNQKNMEGYYFETCEEMTADILSRIPKDSAITWGGSYSIEECGLMDALHQGAYHLLDREPYRNTEEEKNFYGKAVQSNFYLTSANAITYDGELINIDGFGNRLACMMYGPAQVFFIVGANKFVSSVDEGFRRIENIAAPANARRLHRNTPCAETGRCVHCHVPECLCCYTSVIRHNRFPGRLKVFIVAETLGF